MNKTARFVILGLAGTLMLAGCNSDKKKPQGAETDAALNGALGDQIMVDPNMTGENGGPITLPPEQRSNQAIRAAKADAADVAGGILTPPPQPGRGGAAALTETAATAAQVAQAARAAHTDCAGKVAYSNTWAARLPAEIPIYPRGAVREAAGTDSDGCALRVVNYATPVSPEDIMSFYYTMANKAGYGAEYRLDGGDHVMGGRRGGKAYVVYARKLGSGVTEVDLVASGK
ncbi:MAG TPA: hypothetical protein VJQ77_03555 [Novosphingobium sp.]|nr:hypothetical protein [Novosphingobium sp.]